MASREIGEGGVSHLQGRDYEEAVEHRQRSIHPHEPEDRRSDPDRDHHVREGRCLFHAPCISAFRRRQRRILTATALSYLRSGISRGDFTPLCPNLLTFA